MLFLPSLTIRKEPHGTLDWGVLFPLLSCTCTKHILATRSSGSEDKPQRQVCSLVESSPSVFTDHLCPVKHGGCVRGPEEGSTEQRANEVEMSPHSALKHSCPAVQWATESLSSILMALISRV